MEERERERESKVRMHEERKRGEGLFDWLKQQETDTIMEMLFPSPGGTLL